MSITALALIILGGMGNIPGVVVGALVLVGLPEFLREFGEYRLLVYGVVLVGDDAPAARGPAAQPRRGARELHERFDDDEDHVRGRGRRTRPADRW